MSSPPEGRFSRIAAFAQRRRILLGILAALFALRALLPSLLRPVLVDRIDAALVGRIELADLDLSLLRGGVTLHDFSVHTDERPAHAPPLLEARHLWTQISWLALLSRTLELEELEMEGFTVRLDRERDGLRLPRAVANEPETEANDGAPWAFAADGVALRDGEILLVDHTVPGDPETLALAVEDFSARELAVRGAPGDDEPGRISIDAKLDRGAVSLAAWLQQQPNGTDVRTSLVLDDLPIDRLRAYAANYAWRSLSGELDANLEHHYAPGGEHEVKGTLALADLRIEAADYPGEALAWKKLAIAIDRLDLAKRHAELASIEVTGARLLVNPRAATPVALLAPPPAKSGTRNEPATATTNRPASATPAATNASTPTQENSDRSPQAWSWRVARARLIEAVVDLRGAEKPLEIRLDASAGPLGSGDRVASPISLVAKSGAGSARLAGELVAQPPGFTGRLVVRSLALAPLAAQVEAPTLHWLRDGALRADLKLALARDLRMAGTFGVSDLDLGAAPVEKQFAVAWKDLAVDVSDLRVTPPSTRAALRQLTLVEPRVVLTRGRDGLVWPPLLPDREASPAGEPEGGEAPASTGPDDSTTTAASEAPSTEDAKQTPAPVSLSIAHARIEEGSLKLVDRTLEPFYRGRLEHLALDATTVQWPSFAAEQLALSVEGLRGATLTAEGSIGGERSKLAVQLDGLPLAQFNPYLTETGYDLRGGALALASRLRVRPGRYVTKNAIVLTGLDVGGSAGESHFKETFGVSLALARELLSDLDGRITLSLPVRGESDRLEVGVAQLIGQALRKALVGALAAPLKLLRAGRGDGEPGALSPAPIAFRPGESTLAEAAQGRVADVADLLAASPAIRLHLTAWTADSDARIVCERALLAQLEASRGVRALASLGEIARRRAVRLHLEAKFAGRSPRPLADDDQRWLDRQIERAAIPSQALEELGAARVDALRTLLVEEHGVSAGRLVIEPPVLSPRAPQPAVALALGASPSSQDRAQAVRED